MMSMSVRIPTELREAMAEISRKFGAQGGKKAAKNMTAEERSERAKKAAAVAAKKRTAERMARERKAGAAKTAKRK
jgi:hypothetical protein